MRSPLLQPAPTTSSSTASRTASGSSPTVAGGDAHSRAETRFEFHHLADDLRVIAGVPGAARLLKGMLNDVPNYQAYRYELRMAAAVGRAPEQQLLGVGAKDQGPDIVVKTRSKHLCGIACYRAETLTPALRDAHSVTLSIAEKIGLAVAAAPQPAVSLSRTSLRLWKATGICRISDRRAPQVGPATGPPRFDMIASTLDDHRASLLCS
jgi:hypothetical protein